MRYVIHEHRRHDDPVHWDLMLEYGKALKTFRLDCAPQDLAEKTCLATPIFDHHPRFLTYEGPVQEGLGRVKRVDSGTYQSIQMTQQTWTVTLKGQVLHARVILPLMQEDALILVNV